MHLLERMNFTSGDFPRDEDEFVSPAVRAVRERGSELEAC